MTDRIGTAGRREPNALGARLDRVPKPAVFVAVLGVTLLALLLPGPVGAVLTLLLATGAALLLAATWRASIALSTRLARLAAVVAVAVIGVIKVLNV